MLKRHPVQPRLHFIALLPQTEPSASSILQSPTWGAPQAKEMDTPTGTQEITVASRARREATGTLGRNGAPAGGGETAEADSAERGGQTPAGGAGVVTANGGEGPPATEEEEEEGDLERSSLGCGDSERADANAPAEPQYAASARTQGGELVRTPALPA